MNNSGLDKHYNLRVTGLVQGVFFRHYTREKAKELGIKGFVRNEDDGSVYIECEGEESAIKNFINWCHGGPSRARVENVKVEESLPKNYQSFEVEKQ